MNELTGYIKFNYRDIIDVWILELNQNVIPLNSQLSIYLYIYMCEGYLRLKFLHILGKAPRMRPKGKRAQN